MAMFRPTNRLKSADLPTFGRPTIETVPALAAAGLIDFGIGVPFALQLSHAISDIDDSGNESEQSRSGDEVDEGNESKLQHDPTDRDHLQNGGDLSRPMRFHLHAPIEQMQNSRADEDDRIARNDEHWKPGRETSVIGVFAPITDAERDDATEEKTFVRNRIENYA